MKAVVFDLFGTLVPAPWDTFLVSIREMAVVLDIDSQVFFDAWTKETSDRRNTGAFSSLREEVLWICEQNGIEPSEEALRMAIDNRHEFTRSILRPRADAVSTVRALRSMGMLTGLISDCSKEVPELWVDTPFDGLFDTEIFSCSVGVRKPDPAIFRLACERLDVQPIDCLYVGDGFSGELNGARAFGMRPFLLRPPDEDPPDTESWEGTNWDGDVIPSLSAITNELRNEPNEADTGDT